MLYYLMIKSHNKTKLKYLCQHFGIKESCFAYSGSGTYWKRHLKKYGKDISTEILFETNSLEKLKNKGLYYSELYNVVESDEWANLCIETGADGGVIGRKLSEKEKQKISKTLKGKYVGPKSHMYGRKGKNHPHYGKHHSEEAKRKMRGPRPNQAGENNAMFGRKGKNHPKFGTKISEEAKQKVSMARKGKTTWIRGKHHSEETKQKISKASRNRPPEINKQISSSLKKYYSKLPIKMSTCHPNKKHRGKGLCDSCYKRMYYALHYSRPRKPVQFENSTSSNCTG